MKNRKGIVISIIVVLTLCTLGADMYRRNFYPASIEVSSVLEENTMIEVVEMEKGLVFVPETSKAGLIFYPGGMVEYTAYIPLMQEFAKEGILCVLLEMPLSLAVLDMEAAKGIQDFYPEVSSWYIGGHSLGGAMAASYLEKCEEDFSGLLLLAAYSSVDISNKDMDVISVYGDQDKVLNHDKYNEYHVNLPDSINTFVISGGNHSGFAFYGEQKGDGVASISKQEQIALTVEYSVKYMLN